MELIRIHHIGLNTEPNHLIEAIYTRNNTIINAPKTILVAQ